MQKAYGWEVPVVREEFTSWEAARRAAIDINPLKCSGFVAVDAAFNRVGIKSPQFVAMECTLTFSNNGFGPINLNADALDEEGMLELIRHGYPGRLLRTLGLYALLRTNSIRAELLVHYFPRWRPLYERIAPTYHDLCEEIEETYRQISSDLIRNDTSDGDGRRRQKFSQLASRFPYKPVLFALDKGVALTGKPCLFPKSALMQLISLSSEGNASDDTQQNGAEVC